jgi:hypothetical protein
MMCLLPFVWLLSWLLRKFQFTMMIWM